MATYISRVFGTPTNNKIWTLSVWLKVPAYGTGNYFFGAKESDGSGTKEQTIGFTTDGKFLWTESSGSGYPSDLYTNHLLRDPAAWLHIVMATDTTQSTASDRAKFYINGVRVTPGGTDWSLEDYPAEDADTYFNTSGYSCNIGDGGVAGGSDYWKGLMSHCQFVDGLALAPTEFGSVDATSGIWTLKTGAYATPGNNGFFLKFEDSSNLDLDSSSNAHTFTTTGTLTATKDNPSNNFCTLNPLAGDNDEITLSNGNNTATSTSTTNAMGGTLAMSAGKWYWEMELNASNNQEIGIMDVTKIGCIDNVKPSASGNNGFIYSPSGDIYNNGSTLSTGLVTVTTGDIVSMALDITNLKIYWYKNDVLINAGGTTITSGLTWIPVGGAGGGSEQMNADYNFGNGYFGTTAVASTNADDAGIGSFEYDVPAGYYTICTKNIKAYG